MIKKIVLLITFMVGLFLLIAAILPSTYRVERTIMIQVPDSVAYSTTSNFNTWLDWSAWALRDTAAINDIKGEKGSLNHIWSWQGEIVGKGSLQHIRLIPNRKVISELKFVEPQPMIATNKIELTPTPTGTRVSMAIEGSLSYPIERIFGLVMDDLIGPDFEEGLSNLKQQLEEAK